MSDAPPHRGRPGGVGVAGALVVVALVLALSVLLSSCVFDSDPPPPTLSVWPDNGLVDDARVDVRAEHLQPDTQVSFALCEEGAQSVFDDRCFPYDAAPAGEAVEVGSGEGWPVGDDGTAETQLRVYADAYAYDRRVDCRVEPCELVVASDGVVLARAALSFDRGAALVGPARLSVTPATGLAAGEQVEVRGRGFYAGEPVLIEQCAADSTPESCVGGPTERWVADGTGGFVGTFTVQREAATDHQAVDCRSVDCVLRADRYAFVPVASRDVEVAISLER
ncbi:MAG: hypothetical protein JNK12_23290 [Acidimicrobiales bacterium]|nr:hypothetical protein [Acidimicrobiales bacterium]